VVLHDSHDQGIVGQKTVLTAEVPRTGNLSTHHWKDREWNRQEVIQGLAVPGEVLDLGGVTTEPVGDATHGAIKEQCRLNLHEPMG